MVKWNYSSMEWYDEVGVCCVLSVMTVGLVVGNVGENSKCRELKVI